MKTVILAGGMGTRLAEETSIRPKPLVEIGERPILWHIMKTFAHYGHEDFVICLGYKGYMIKDYFLNYALHTSDVTIDLAGPGIEMHAKRAERWKVTLVDTGLQTMTGGRLKRVRQFLGDEPFFMTYGDGVGSVDIAALLELHRRNGRAATVTATRAPGRFGALRINESLVERMVEKPAGESGWINGGYFVLEPRALDLIEGDQTIWERDPMERLAAEGELSAFQHEGFWQPMDTLREKVYLEDLWNSGKAPWKIWAD